MNADFIQFSLDVIGPVMLVLVAGKTLYATGHLSDAFVAGGSRLVFNFALPALLFISISQADFSQAANPALISVGVLCTLMFFVAALLSVHMLFTCRADRGVIVQGSFRANLGVVGLAYAVNTFAADEFAQASVYMGALILVYNVLSVWVLNHYLPNRLNALNTVFAIARNPIMLSIIAALLFSYFNLSLPTLLQSSTEYFAQLTLPLALLCTGASIRFRGMGGQRNALLFAVISKCFLYPLFLVAVGYLVNFNQTEQLTLLFMAVAPTAAVSFIMVKSMGGNTDLAANIVAVSTIVSIPATLVGYIGVTGMTS
ncbi:AEC family transporter [Alteromonas oceanisediminis]|uniref:AEC family transporter n=1 Tax=Alteromonas oceanisediminis TaxID=2836180 RepID=UPI001BD92795|nr:AEC family transporter [Alteromonas oceanisediminis]MBT0585334.1 AEC family transporter [Alteromonas oceanisediminis]